MTAQQAQQQAAARAGPPAMANYASTAQLTQAQQQPTSQQLLQQEMVNGQMHQGAQPKDAATAAVAAK